jgi:hypothetical protein
LPVQDRVVDGVEEANDGGAGEDQEGLVRTRVVAMAR